MPNDLDSIIVGDALETLRGMATGSVHCCVTSPPYWGLRDYGTATWEGGDADCDHSTPRSRGDDIKADDKQGTSAGSRPNTSRACGECGARRIDAQLGLEPTPEIFVAKMVEIFAEVRRVLRDDGTLFLNLGDSYAANRPYQVRDNKHCNVGNSGSMSVPPGLKPKDLCGIPWRLALALQADGWYLRSDIIWCLSGGARVYARTQKGVMPMMIKDLVRLRPETVELWNGFKWTQVVSFTENKRPDNPLEIELRTGEKIGCTPGHVWPTQRGNIPASELVAGDVVKTCNNLPSGDRPTDAVFPQSLARIVGLYVAEGSRSGNTLQFSLHAKEQGLAADIRRFATHYGGTANQYVNGNKLTVNVEGGLAKAVIDLFVAGKTSHDKHLTTRAWQHDNAFLADLLMGYLQGDGHWDEKNERWRIGFTRNDSLAADLRTMCARLHSFIRLRTSHATCNGKRFPSYRGEIRFKKNNHGNSKPCGEIVNIGRSRARKFWDIEVASEPHLFSLASGVLTHNSKPNPMPESCTDRPTKAHEYLFLLTKRARYYYDADAIREPHSLTLQESQARIKSNPKGGDGRDFGSAFKQMQIKKGVTQHPAGRNKRTVWTIPTHSFSGAHFATFPPKLIEPCILAGVPERCCADCGAPWVRVVEKESHCSVERGSVPSSHRSIGQPQQAGVSCTVKTTGHRPTCKCNGATTAGTVLDPFGGAGTVGLVAKWNQRHYILVELNPDYAKMARGRIETETAIEPEAVVAGQSVKQLDMLGAAV